MSHAMGGTIKEWLEDLGICPRKYSGHSLRKTHGTPEPAQYPGRFTPEYQEQLQCDTWEVVVPELIFEPS